MNNNNGPSKLSYRSVSAQPQRTSGFLTLDDLVLAGLAGTVGGAYNYLTETNPTYMNMDEYLRYAALVAGANLVGTKAVQYLIPNFKNQHLRNLEHILTSAGSTAATNLAAQYYLNSDFRIPHNLIAGGLGGGSAPLARTMLPF